LNKEKTRTVIRAFSLQPTAIAKRQVACVQLIVGVSVVCEGQTDSVIVAAMTPRAD